MKLYLGYIRVSTVRQGENGSSLVEQRASIEAYAKRNDIRIAEWFEETETAAKGGRRVFNRMIAKLRGSRYAGVVIHKIDRSARNLKDWASLGELIDAGVQVHFTHESLDLSSRGGRLAADIQAVVAADYIRNLRDEVLKGFYGRLKQGYYPLPAPPGYLNQGAAKYKTICPAKGPIVRYAFEAYATGDWTLHTLRHELWKRGLRGAGDKPLSIQTIAEMLHNSFYFGLIRIRTTGDTFVGGHEPLIQKSLYERVQRVMSGRAMLWDTPRNYPYRKLISCQVCGRWLVGETQKGRVYYRCHKRGCGQKALRQDRIETTIFEVLQGLRMTSGDLMDLRACAASYQAEARREQEDLRAKAERELDLVKERLTRTVDAYLDGTLEKELYLERKASLLGRQAELQETVKTGDGEIGRTNVMLQLAVEAQNRFPDASPEEKRAFIQSLAARLTAHQGALILHLKSPFDRMADQK